MKRVERHAGKKIARWICIWLTSKIGAVLRFDDAGGAGQRQLRQVVLVEAFDHVAFARGQGGLRGDQGQVVVHAGVDAVGFVG